MRSFISGILILLPVLAGCRDTLETGYVPRKLNATEPERRAYYASKYSPEANVEKSPNSPAPSSGRMR